jgi:hypothetical protein
MKKSFSKNILTVSSQVLNVFLMGDPDMTISTRAYVNARLIGGKWIKIEKFLNFIFRDEQHCKLAYLRDVEYAKKIFYIRDRLN